MVLKTSDLRIKFAHQAPHRMAAEVGTAVPPIRGALAGFVGTLPARAVAKLAAFILHQPPSVYGPRGRGVVHHLMAEKKIDRRHGPTVRFSDQGAAKTTEDQLAADPAAIAKIRGDLSAIIQGCPIACLRILVDAVSQFPGCGQLAASDVDAALLAADATAGGDPKMTPEGKARFDAMTAQQGREDAETYTPEGIQDRVHDVVDEELANLGQVTSGAVVRPEIYN